MRRSASILIVAVAAALPVAPASAGIFDDEEARKQIVELGRKTDERFDTATSAQLNLARQIETLNAEIAKLRGQIELLGHELEAAQKRQRDFYVDLDTRLRAAEKAIAEPKPAPEPPPPPPPPKVDPAIETQAYETALNHFKQARYKEALAALEAFVGTYPESPLLPSAQFWLGNSHYALRDCKKSIDAQNVVVSRWPASPKAPDAMLAVATCQQELGNAIAARRTLEVLVTRYPDAPAADTAKQRLRKK